MKIIEEYLSSKTPNSADCEDAIFKSTDFIAVIDGATSKTKIKYNNLNPGNIGKDIAIECLKMFEANIDHRNAISFLTNRLAQFYKDNNVYSRVLKRPQERITLSAVIFSKYHKEVWMVGDCQCIINEKLYTNKKKIDELLANIRSLYLNSELLKGKTFEDILTYDSGRNFITPVLKRQYLFQNNPNAADYSYGAIDGFDVQDKDIKKISNFNSNIIVLASDGYPKLFSDLLSSEEYLEEVIKLDPLCYKKFKSTKGVAKGNISYDDRAYIKFSF